HYISLLTLFLCLIPHPLTSKLFPYTTLFRSSSARFLGILQGGILRMGHSFALHLLPSFLELKTPHNRRVIIHMILRLIDPASALDRKSTRLNSSHLGISYAVFCLKQKKLLLK